MKYFKFLSVFVMIALLLSAFFPSSRVQAQSEAEQQTIVEIAAGDPQFSTLVTAIQAAGLVDTLNGPGPFTVFAPTNDAFAQLPEGTLEALLADPAKLQSILLYHVASGSQFSGDLAGQSAVMTVNGQYAPLTVQGERLFINNARVTTADIAASNGVIHVIDRVILPAEQDVVGMLQRLGQFNTLLAAVEAAGLVETLQGASYTTIFAPTDAAFDRLPEGTLEALLANPEQLKSILLYHAVSGPFFAGDVAKQPSATTINGANVMFSIQDGEPYVNDARIRASNYRATNGVIHVINQVLVP